MLKEALITSPILKYPDPNKAYTLFTDASKHAWACVLTREYQYKKDGKTFKMNHPITFASGLFKGSRLNWATLTKEAIAIYSSIKKLSYYLEDADIILRSDHLPLKKFLQKNTLNSKVNNWAVEISPCRIQFEYIKGIKNTLVDIMSRLIQIDPEAKLQPEQEGYEFGYHAFEDMEAITCEVNVVDIDSSGDPIPLPGEDIKLPLDSKKLKDLQQKDKFCKDITSKLEKGQLQNKNPYYQEEGILKRFVEDGKQRFEAVVLPQVLTSAVLQLVHEGLGQKNNLPDALNKLRISTFDIYIMHKKFSKSSIRAAHSTGSICEYNKEVNNIFFDACFRGTIVYHGQHLWMLQSPIKVG